MVCSLVKKGLLGAALGAGTLFLVFGTSAPSYIKTAFHKVRQSAKESIDPRFEIERARTELGYRPTTDMYTGLSRCLEWWQQRSEQVAKPAPRRSVAAC